MLKASSIPRGPLWGKLQRGDDVIHGGVSYKSVDFCKARKAEKIIVCGDNDKPDLLEPVCDGCNLLVHESTFTADLKEKALNVGHSYAQLVAEFAEHSGVPNLILTHVSPRYGDVNGMLDEAQRVFSGSVHIAEDFHRYRISGADLVKL